jgi:hypothetical protein
MNERRTEACAAGGAGAVFWVRVGVCAVGICEAETRAVVLVC